LMLLNYLALVLTVGLSFSGHVDNVLSIVNQRFYL
jgi:hypothetical protein